MTISRTRIRKGKNSGSLGGDLCNGASLGRSKRPNSQKPKARDYSEDFGKRL